MIKIDIKNQSDKYLRIEKVYVNICNGFERIIP
jgi:hypothetical protein